MEKAVVILSVVCVLLCISEVAHPGSSSRSKAKWLTYYVDGVRGNDSLCSLPESMVPCRSLEHIAKHVAFQEGSVKIVIQSPRLSLKEVVHFGNCCEIWMTGSHTHTTIECVSKEGRTNSSSAGLIFYGLKQVTIEDVTIYHCGVLSPKLIRTWHSLENISCAVHTIDIRTLVVRNTNVMQSSGTGIVIITGNQSSVVNISNCHFVGNKVSEQDVSQYMGGGGVDVRMWNTKDSRLIFHKCQFQSNKATAENSFTFLTSFGITIRGSGEGGGLKIYLYGTTSFNNISVSQCNFSENLAFSGGGLSVQMFEGARKNLVDIQDSIFERNGCPPDISGQTTQETTPVRTGSGGGILLGYHLRKANCSNHYSIQRVEFTENCAEIGGGISFYSTRSISSSQFDNNISFVNSTWSKNSARIGAAVDISPQVNSRLSAGFLPTPVFTNCCFIANNVAFRMEHFQQTLGVSTLFSSLLNVLFKSSVYFEGNSGSAFVIVNGIANFSTCNATFTNNKGVQGGAIALIGTSSLLIGPGYHYIFINNTAADRGGAIYSYLIDIHDFTSSKSCFIQYLNEPGMNTLPPEWNTAFTFSGNQAQGPGNSIFVSSIWACMPGFVIPRDTDSDVNSDMMFSSDNIGKHQIATDGTRFNVTGTPPFKVIPGEEHRLELTILDDLNQTVNTTFRASVPNSMILVGATFSCVTDNVIQLEGREEDNGSLLLQTMTPQASSVTIDVVLTHCPPGFKLKQKKCSCDAQSYYGLTGCSDSASEMFSYIRKGRWAGYINTEELVTATCPFEFCSYNGSTASANTIRLPRNQSILNEWICGPKRTGILCGKCAQGYTVYYHSPYYSCSEERLCNWGWLFYILSEIIPVTLLFVLVLIFNISFTSGAVNGFILFSQLLDTLQINTSYCGVNSFICGYRIIYGFFNMEFFNIEPLSFCIWKHATVLHVLTFKYMTIAYALFLVFCLVLFMKYYGHRCLGKCIRVTTVKNSVIHGLATFLVICYGQCIKVSFSLLLPVILHGKKKKAYRVLLNGEIKHFSKEHFPYVAAAILCLLTIGAVLPTLLLAYPLTNRLLTLCHISDSNLVTSVSRKISISKLKPFLDTFQGCFKDNFRFFSGLYFAYRWVGLVVYAFRPHLSAFYPLLESVLIVILTVHAVAQPYESRWHNIVDAFLLANLLIVNSFSGFNYCHNQKTDRQNYCDRDTKGTSIMQTIIIYLPIFYMVTYLVVSVCKKYCGWKKEAFKKSNTQVCIKLEDFPARLLGDDVEYDEVNDSSPF